MYKIRIVIYGIGDGCRYVLKQLNNNTEVLAYSDSYAKICHYLGKPFVEPYELNTIEFDYLIITIKDKNEASQIAKRLNINYGVHCDKIIKYFWSCNHEKYISKLAKNHSEIIDYLILGNSKAECGIVESLFPGACLNMAVSSQDIYFNIVTALKVHAKKKISTIIFDLYDYTYFNIDTSLGKYSMSYYSVGGYRSPIIWRKKRTLNNDYFWKT